MASTLSSALYIDFSRLPPPKVVEEIDYEALVKIYQNQVVAKLPTLARAMALQQSPANVVLQAQAYGEMLVRSRVNSAARAVMLPFAKGSDLDALAAFYNEPRVALVDNPRNVDLFPQDWESDASLRRKAQLKPETFSTAGTMGSYVYHGLKADVTIKDVSATKINNRGGIKIAVMGSGSDPTPTPVQIAAVTKRLFSKDIKPLTDVLSIAPAFVVPVDLKANVTLYQGPDASLVMADIVNALERLRSQTALLGQDLTRAAIFSALTQAGVQNVEILSPIADVVVGRDACVWLKSAAVTPLLARAD